MYTEGAKIVRDLANSLRQLTLQYIKRWYKALVLTESGIGESIYN